MYTSYICTCIVQEDLRNCIAFLCHVRWVSFKTSIIMLGVTNTVLISGITNVYTCACVYTSTMTFAWMCCKHFAASMCTHTCTWVVYSCTICTYPKSFDFHVHVRMMYIDLNGDRLYTLYRQSHAHYTQHVCVLWYEGSTVLQYNICIVVYYGVCVSWSALPCLIVYLFSAHLHGDVYGIMCWDTDGNGQLEFLRDLLWLQWLIHF